MVRKIQTLTNPPKGHITWNGLVELTIILKIYRTTRGLWFRAVLG